MILPILQFTQAKGSGEAAIRRLLSFAEAHGEDAVLAVCSSAHSLQAEIGINPDVAQSILDAKSAAQEIADELHDQDVSVIWHGSSFYPERLASILRADAPPVLFVRGKNTLLAAPGVGFCGSRRASQKGIGLTGKCAKQLADEGTCVVSGYAAGVDMAAHRSALESGGTTIFVLAEGILRFKPKRGISDLLAAGNHCAVSQFAPRLTWSSRNAMRRNSTIIGLSDAMILVESGLSGGTFAAGEETLRRKRPLFVIDFAEPGPSAEANPHFIRQGGLSVRRNPAGLPNLDKVRSAVGDQSWRNTPSDTPSLFDRNRSR